MYVCMYARAYVEINNIAYWKDLIQQNFCFY